MVATLLLGLLLRTIGKKYKKLEVKYITSNMLPLTNFDENFKPHFWDFILIVFEIRRLEDAILMPLPSYEANSVKAIGAYRNPILSELEVTNCDLQLENSFLDNSNIKSLGNRLIFLRTACLRTLVSTL